MSKVFFPSVTFKELGFEFGCIRHGNFASSPLCQDPNTFLTLAKSFKNANKKSFYKPSQKSFIKSHKIFWTFTKYFKFSQNLLNSHKIFLTLTKSWIAQYKNIYVHIWIYFLCHESWGADKFSFRSKLGFCPNLYCSLSEWVLVLNCW